MGKRIGYVRVSTVEQNTARQDDKLKGMQLDRIFEDKASGKDRNRPQLNAMLDYVQAGDIVYVDSLSRLGRSTFDLLEISKELRAKGVILQSLTESIDLTSPAGTLTFTILSAIAEFERACIKQRQMEGIASAKERGKTWGNEKKYLVNEREEDDFYMDYYNGKFSADEGMEKTGMSKFAFYNRYNKWKKKMEKSGMVFIDKRKKSYRSQQKHKNDSIEVSKSEDEVE